MLTNALAELWVGPFGAPAELITDGEAGLTSTAALTSLQENALAQKYFLRHNNKCHVRAPNMHARYIERRGALFREVIHKIESQLRKDGIVLPFEAIVAEAVFAGNALLTVNGSSPYNAVFGRVPRILPSVDQTDAPDRTMATMPPVFANVHRLREIAVAAMVEGSAQARLNAALRSRSTAANEILNLKVGDSVDFFRPPPIDQGRFRMVWSCHCG